MLLHKGKDFFHLYINLLYLQYILMMFYRYGYQYVQDAFLFNRNYRSIKGKFQSLLYHM